MDKNDSWTKGIAEKYLKSEVPPVELGNKNKTGECVVEDVKGQKTSAYQIKKKWFEKLYYPQTITEVQA